MEKLYELLDMLIADAEEMGGVGAHTTPIRAAAAYTEARTLLDKIEAGVAAIRKELEGKGYELYLTQ